MVKQRAKVACVSPRICNHTFGAIGIIVYLSTKGTLEHARHFAAHDDKALRPHQRRNRPRRK
jgi:hypothetical protein